jgi:dGTPase
MKELTAYKNALQHLAFADQNSRGRKLTPNTSDSRYDDDACLFGVVSPFAIDCDKITNSKAFRRLISKTQVFPTPRNPHIRTRLQHTLEVTTLATVLAEILGLNVNLCRAIAMGHDLGHAPFGHFGERFISEHSGKPFNHAINGVVVAQEIERKGGGLNLCYETLLGILHHSSTKDLALEITPHLIQEINVVKLADKLCYTFSDYNDARRVGYITEPNDTNIRFFGERQRQWLNTCIIAIVAESAEKGHIAFDDREVATEFRKLREWLYVNVYAPINFEVQKNYCARIIDFFSQDSFFKGCDPFLLLSLLTDREVFQFGDLCNTAIIPNIGLWQNTSLSEIVPWIREKAIDFTDPGLNW